MIYKSYLVEQDFSINENLTLFYGENLGLKNHFQNKIKDLNKNNEVIIYNQEDVIKNKNQVYNEILNISLFNDKKVFLVNGVTDKIIDQVLENWETKNLFFFRDIR